MKPTVDVIIPSFNGKYLLEKHLPKVIRYTEYLNKVIIIENGSTDETIPWLQKNFPEVVVVKNNSNLGFTKPVNQGVAVSKSDYLILLNNDVEPKKDYLKNIFDYFKDEMVFAVSFNEDGSSWPLVSWHDGKLQFIRGVDKAQPMYSAWASGGSGIFRRSIWDKLGGLNEIYAPFYWEDIGIGYRAWKMGYKIIWDNRSIVYHQHESTANKINQNYVKLIRQRNELLFNWINITDKDLLRSHLYFLIRHSLRHPRYLQVIFAALFRLPQNRQSKDFVISDSEVLSRVNKKYE
ncbi:hypothetical protein A3K29_02885 [Candidatus Collierbacteria bacterium RIFOXYB2_FULL_46_14]|uniref:Glycosyl transferase, group 2 family protein n=1 Tax=Candidatus Collierbacteria bacterium GW2011_GWA2_46_26 TaxID=1618381 RepID=A0A0G1PM94_9BACT|nr:MAG: Glycosyl transferase, group 2 family protein [Candidatus Collierbacteria bacterium GW2011_GWC2_44_13]KKU33866.1 MAG: Glycosyl transferase, group 2 family protein [Candidatus Collierbacteria bacterium GW2011_GWA2_46_26]OGD73065.1 MAG: hypothetical protein A3K29_02885 [Candidatus Collierbacteria bacterium RIFOXYB2_FULL_46_14]OGD76107.1 MAG: hypothetical protein A3K43_02885 [Candidatus Collierbacteria bacterium RIFOXYA2_FULL_46_20]OGD77443.1 MAG: hypothetical protein A3K39_02885 [Candidatu